MRSIPRKGNPVRSLCRAAKISFTQHHITKQMVAQVIRSRERGHRSTVFALLAANSVGMDFCGATAAERDLCLASK